MLIWLVIRQMIASSFSNCLMNVIGTIFEIAADGAHCQNVPEFSRNVGQIYEFFFIINLYFNKCCFKVDIFILAFVRKQIQMDVKRSERSIGQMVRSFIRDLRSLYRM